MPNDLRDVENQVRAAKAHDVDSVVRVSRGSNSDLIHPNVSADVLVIVEMFQRVTEEFAKLDTLTVRR